MQKKFKSIQKAHKFAKTTKMKVKRGKACKMADGTKGAWYTLTKGKKKPKKR